LWVVIGRKGKEKDGGRFGCGDCRVEVKLQITGGGQIQQPRLIYQVQTGG
jgi:hypothetical protein